MKTLQKTLIALAAGSVVTMGAQAAVTYGSGYAGQPYIGVKAGQFNVDEDGVDTDDPTAYGVYGGYNFDPNFGIEAEYIGSDDADFEVDGIEGEYDVKTYGAYGTYRYTFPTTGIYAKGKLGVAKSEISGDAEGDDTGIAGGVGLGYNVNSNLAIEGEYAMYPSIDDTDIDAITIGAHLKF